MPIKIPDQLPATSILEGENIFVMTEHRAMHQDIRPLRVLLLNLMPTKVATETQILRKLSNTPLQIEVELLRTASYTSTNTSQQHLESFYCTFDEVRHDRFDGLIITGAPVELLEFEDVDYWPELCEIMDWAHSHVFSTLYICWGAMAGIYYHYGIPKVNLGEKLSGVYQHTLEKITSPLVRGFDTLFNMPHSRYTGVELEDVLACPELEVIATSEEAGVAIVKSTDSRDFFVFGHGEYDHDTLRLEYERDVARGLNPNVPEHYFPNDDPTAEPHNVWKATGQLLYTNWTNYYLYQATPYDLNEIGR
ncbi:MAG: homoserine O-succinyltransferase [Eggerthellaceae bacterium]|nr:homoserine O-succinyltransferase [Eggerthellaceae bacterium]